MLLLFVDAVFHWGVNMAERYGQIDYKLSVGMTIFSTPNEIPWARTKLGLMIFQLFIHYSVGE